MLDFDDEYFGGHLGETRSLVGSLDLDPHFQDLPYRQAGREESSVHHFRDIQNVLLIHTLAQRDQRKQAVDELDRLGWKPQGIEAVTYPDPWQLGMICSHIKCLEFAKKQNWDHVLICRDHVMFRDNTEFVQKKIDTFLSRHPDWAVILLEAIILQAQYLDDASARVTKSWGAGSYMVRRPYYDILLHNYRQAARNTFHKKDYSNLDNIWHSLQRRDPWYCVLPLLSLPRPSKNDPKQNVLQKLKKFCIDMKGYPEREQLRFNDFPFKVELEFQQTVKETPEIEQLLRPIVVQTIYRELDNAVPKRLVPLKRFEDIRHVLYINLDDRPDRNAEVDAELRRVGFTAQRVSGFRIPGNGSRGCNLSHLKCLEMAKRNNWSHVLICEDDVLFRTNVQLVREKITTCLQRHQDWDVLTLGPNVREAEYVDDCTARVFKSWCAAAYIVRQEYYDVLLHTFKCATRGNIIADATWSHLSTRDCWYTVLPLMVVQRPSKSDLEQKIVDYRQLLITNSFNQTRNYCPNEREKYFNAEF